MATTASFKQQCPSCEAMVPIRDANLIGRKIDCPKCKYRFVVEDPGIAEDEEEASKPSRSRGEDKGANGAKGKAGARRRDEDDDDDEDKAPAKSGGNNKLILGVGLSVVAVGLLVVVGYFLLAGGDSSSASKSSGTSSQAASNTQKTEPANEDKPAEAAPAASSVSVEVLTNLMPPDTEGVCLVHMQELMRTALGRAIFESPGSFRSDALQRKLGFSIDDVDAIVQGWNFSQNWSLNVIHSTKTLNLEAVKAALGAKPADKKIEDQEYFILDNNPWLDMVGQATFATMLQSNPLTLPVRSGPRFLRVYDEQTLVFADPKPMELFLSKKGVFDRKSPDAAPSGGETAKGKDTEEGGGPGNMQGMRGKMGGMGRQGGGGPPPGMMMGGGAGGNPMQGGQPKPEEPAAGPSGAYLTLGNTGLKTMLDRVEAKHPVISLALDTYAAQNGRVQVLGINLLNMKTIFEEANIIGAALQFKDGITFTVGAGYKTEDDQAKHLKSIQKQDATELAGLLTKALETKVEYTEEDVNQFAGNQGGQGGGMGMAPGMGNRQGAPGGPLRPGAGGGGGGGFGGPPQGMMMPPAQGGGQPGGRGGMDPENGGMGMMRGGGMGGMMRGGMGQQQGTQEKKDEKPSSTVKVSAPDKTMVILTIHLIDQTANSKLIDRHLRQLVMRQKGNLDMAGGQLRIHELGVAVRSYPEAAPHEGKDHVGMFPRGTVERQIPTSRDGRPYPPNERLSWLVELLPYLGPEQQALYGQIDRQKSWRHEDNLPLASTLVPQFLDPGYPQSSWWAKAPGGEAVGATHFVGIAGVGLDAAEYEDSDPAVANKLGIFGYDRTMRLSDITDKTSNTILLIQTPPTYKRPWMAGGGATIAGVPETGSIRPFVSTQRDGKRGTHVLMADGSVRFISEGISDDVFKALCTAKGGEAVFVNRDAPLVPPPEGQPELKVVQPQILAAQPKKRAADTGWQQFTSREGGFTVLLPGTPKEQTQSVQNPLLGLITAHTFSVHVANDDDYHIRYEDFTLPPGASFDLEKAYDAVRDVILTRLSGAKVVKETKISLDNNPGREIRFDVPGHGVARGRFLILKSKAYILEASGSQSFVDSGDTEKFFDSFKLLSKSAQNSFDPSKDERKQGNSNDSVVAILNKNCATCHTGARAKGKPPFQLFAGQGVLNASVAADRLLEVLESGKMPPRGRPRLQAEEVAMLQKWAQSKN